MKTKKKEVKVKVRGGRECKERWREKWDMQEKESGVTFSISPSHHPPVKASTATR